jgi:predicted ATP-grasp superfamily ATP-dependent carboligase
MSALILHGEVDLRRPVVIAAFGGWNDAGQAATTTVRFLAEQWAAQPYASIDPEEFFDFTVNRPQVRLAADAQRTVEWTSVEFLSARVAAGEHDYVLGWGPEPHLKWKAFCATVVELARHCQAEMVVTVGAFLGELLYDDPVPITGFASNAELIANWNLTPTRYEGPTGIVGVLGDAVRRAGLPHVSLWAALPHYIAAMPNPRGALALLLRLSATLQIPIDLTPLQKAAARFEQAIEEAIAGDPKLETFVADLRKRSRVN